MWPQGSPVSIRVARGSAALLSIHGRGIGPQRVEEGISSSFSSCGRKPWVPLTCAGDLRELLGVPLRSQILWSWERPLGTPLGMAQWKRASSRVEAGTSGFIYISVSDRTVPAELGQESQAFSCVEERNSACLSSSSRDDRPLVDLCLESACFSVLCMGMSVPLRVVHSSTGLLSKRCPGIGFLLRADRERMLRSPLSHCLG